MFSLKNQPITPRRIRVAELNVKTPSLHEHYKDYIPIKQIHL